jgi:molecular chaperone GrpE
MTDPTARQGDEAVAETENGQGNGAPVQDPLAQATAEADPLNEAKREAAEFKDKLLRTLAEMENLRKRTEREVVDARLYGVAGFAREVLAVADNMHRALEAIGPELREHADAKVKALIEGVELTERELLKALEKHGVKKFSPLAEKFDPNVHQAMFELESEDVPPGHVAQVIQAGYMIGDRVLRPAMVAVAKTVKVRKPANDNPGDIS